MKLDKIFYLMCIATTFFGGVVWLANIDNKATASAAQLEKVQSRLERTQVQFEEIRTRLTHIEDMLRD